MSEETGSEGASILRRLQTPDDMTLRFSPYGLGGRMPPTESARFLNAIVESLALGDAVPEETRSTFERVRRAFHYGLLEYELFTAAADLAYLALEGAFRARFVDFHALGLPLRREASGVIDHDLLLPRDFERIRKRAQNGWQLVRRDGSQRRLPTTLPDLFRWAREEGLLVGQRSRQVDRAVCTLRNLAAHPEGYTLQTPPDVATTLGTIAEIINKLWGIDTPGGRLFPAPIERRARAAAIRGDGEAATEFRSIEQALHHARTFAGESWQYAVFLAADAESLTAIRKGLEFAHRPGFQTTNLPCDQLWGPDSAATFLAEVEDTAFAPSHDRIDHLDRIFLVRRRGDGIDDPRSPADVLNDDALFGDGEWFALRADNPWDAFVHVRDHPHALSRPDGGCTECPVAPLGHAPTALEALATAPAG